MVKSMASVKVTITVPEKQLAAIRKKVAAGEATSISAYFQESVAQSLGGSSALLDLFDELLERSGGPLTAKEREAARAALHPRKRTSKGKRAA
jgi:Arc/MetJ-type ribon-helix-helix transcriptional regulator